MNDFTYGDCTMVCNNPQNAPRISAARKRLSNKSRYAQEEYECTMSEMGETPYKPSGEIHKTVIDMYDGGLCLSLGNTSVLEKYLSSSCPSCGERYGTAEILERSCEVCGDTYIRCMKCNYKQKIEEMSDC